MKNEIIIDKDILELWLDLAIEIHKGFGSGRIDEIFLAGIACLELQNKITEKLNDFSNNIE